MPPHAHTLLRHLHRLTTPPTPDATLLVRWREQHDEAAFAELVDRHGPMVLGVCRRVLGDVQHAEDVFQATFLTLARKAGHLRRPEALASFLYGIALRLARKARGAAARRPVQPSADAPEPADPQPHPLDVLSGRELLALLDEEIARLPEVYRLPLLLCVLQERSVEEAARALGWSVGSVRGRLARGRERLRQRLSRRGLALSIGAVALLAPAVLPQPLRAAALRNLVAPTPSAVNALMASGVPKLKAVCLGLLVLAAGLGASLPFLHAPEPEAIAAAAPPAPPAQAKGQPRRDLHGDPLPPGAVLRLGTLRFRAPAEIEALAVAPDGKTLAASSRGGLFLMDAASGKRIRRLDGPEGAWGPDRPLVFSPDGKYLAARGQAEANHRLKDVVHVWPLAGGDKPRVYDAEHAFWVGWSTDGEPLAACLGQGEVRLHELASGRVRHFAGKDLSRPELSGYVACACSPAGASLAIVDEPRRVVHVWDTATGRERYTLRPKGANIAFLSFSPDGRTLATLGREAGGVAVQLWDAATGQVRHTVATDQKYLTTLAFSPDSKTLATASWNDVRFWDVATGREKGRTQDKSNFAATVAFSPDGKMLVTAEQHGCALHLWDIATGQRKSQPAGHRCWPHGTAFTPDGRRVATGGGLDGTILVWDLQTGESLVRIQRPKWVRDVAFSPDGRSLFSTWTDEELWISEAVTGEKQGVLQLEDPDRPGTYQSAISMYPSADGQTLVALSFYYQKNGQGPRPMETLITGWDTSTRKQLFRRRRPGIDSWVALSPDARVLAMPEPQNPARDDRGTGKGPMHLEDVATGELLLTFPQLEGQTWPLAFSPDGRLLASNNSNYKRRGKKDDPAGATGSALRLWETATAAEVLALPIESQYRTAFSPDGRLLALIAPGQEILVYDLAHGRERQRFKGFHADVTHLTFSPDGRRLLSGLSDSTYLVWDLGPRQADPPARLDADRVAKLWADLAGDDAPRAFRARWTLVSAPVDALPSLKEHLHPIRPADPECLRRLLTDLESEQFAVREKAQADLEELGELAEPALRQALEGQPALEMRRRVQAVLERLRGPVTRPQTRRALRAVAVLENIATPEARRLLEELAAGAPAARLTREAKASLHRLDLRRPSGP
jgi:RNA polymerase sigma factor (sigma-70 family)